LAVTDFKRQSKKLYYFVIPFLIIAGTAFWHHLRISRPDAALETAHGYLKSLSLGETWDLSRMTLVGEGLGKKWRLEFSSVLKDGRRVQANLLVDRWIPGNIIGKFILILSPPQILDGGWNNPTFLDRVSARTSRLTLFVIGLVFLAFQIAWLAGIHRRGQFKTFDGPILVSSGGILLLLMMITELPPAFLVVYPLIFTFSGIAVGKGERKGNGR